MKTIVVKYQMWDKNDRKVFKVKEFDSEAKMQKFIANLVQSDDFAGTIEYSRD